MFRFDSFKKTNNATTTLDNYPLTSDGTQSNTSFLQRIASSDTILGVNTKRPLLSKSTSTNSVSTTTTSFSIPMPTNWGMLALSKLQDTEDGEMDDIVDLLLNREKAMLLLPVSTPSLPSAIIDREFIMDHVIVNKDNQVISLSGVRGIFQKDQFIALGLLPTEQEITSLMTDETKKSLFDTFSLDPSSITPDHPKYNILASHVQLQLREERLITVMLIQRPLSKKEVVEWMETKAKNVKSIGYPLKDPSSPKIDEFIRQYKKNPPRSIDTASNKILDFLDDLHEDNGVEKERLDVIETYLCNQLYDQLFTNPDGDEAMQDEALESRIAALNLLDLDLSHLGVLLEDPVDIENMNQIVRLAGTQLQQLNTIMGAKEKLEALIKTHQIIVDAIEEFAKNKQTLDDNTEVVQEIKHAMSTVSSANADVLLPILIFTIVKSNPTNFLSNLKFIQRYRRPEELSGQASYCLTNMMAAVSFLETTNLVGLGLSADRVYSHITDLNATKLIQSKQQQQQQPNNSGLRIVSDVVDSSYRVFDGIGKFWQRNTQELENSKAMSGLVNRVRKVSDAAQPMLKEGLSELKEMTITTPSTTTSGKISSDLPSFMESRSHRANSLKIKQSEGGGGPIEKFLEMKSVEELTIGEVTMLLADYKRLAAIIKQANLA
ncbi:unnamed protein product [Mucor hiemalis]